jgi:hypothetical protein
VLPSDQGAPVRARFDHVLVDGTLSPHGIHRGVDQRNEVKMPPTMKATASLTITVFTMDCVFR